MLRPNVFRDLLQAGDVHGVMRVWAKLYPDWPQPQNAEEGRIMMHYARTQAASVGKAERVYSHFWLVERGIPSALPNELMPKAEQVEQKIVTAVGVAVLTQTPELIPVAKQVEKAMADAVADCYANGDIEPAIVQARMAEAQTKALAQLLGH